MWLAQGMQVTPSIIVISGRRDVFRDGSKLGKLLRRARRRRGFGVLGLLAFACDGECWDSNSSKSIAAVKERKHFFHTYEDSVLGFTKILPYLLLPTTRLLSRGLIPLQKTQVKLRELRQQNFYSVINAPSFHRSLPTLNTYYGDADSFETSNRSDEKIAISSRGVIH